MVKTEIRKKIESEVIKILAQQTGRRLVPAASSNRHVHLSRADLETLFGAGYSLTELRPLSQPGQIACEETVTLVGSKGSIAGIRVLGPERKETQVEVSVTDSFKLGIKPVVKMSGELDNTPGAKLIGPRGSVELQKGVIVAARHLHLSADQARGFNLQNGDVVKLRYNGFRPVIFENVIVRSGDGHEMEVHLDTDEANAALIKNGDYMEIID
jgi:putative phosphotransacetylase